MCKSERGFSVAELLITTAIVSVMLAGAYQSCLNLAEQYQHKSIAFPSISTGAYGYPIRPAASIALGTVIEHIKQPTSLQQVMFVLFDKKTYDAYEQVLKNISGQ